METVSNNPKNQREGCAIAFIVMVICLLIWGSMKGCAQTTKQPAVYDTIQIDNSLIKKYCTITNKNGKEQTYAVLISGETEELVSVSQTVNDYIKLCKENGIKPSLALKLRNGQISSIIRFKNKYKKSK